MSSSHRSLRQVIRRSLVLGAVSALVLSLVGGTASATHGSARGTSEVCPPPDTTVTDEFPDDDGVHEDNINCAAAYNLVQGFPDGTYGPGEPITRAQMATFVANLVETCLGEALPVGTDQFTDDDGSVHEDNINKLANAGIVSGVSGTEYNPTGTVSRGQMATFIANALDYCNDQVIDGDEPPATTTDHFTDDDGTTHEDNINRLHEQLIVVGTGGTNFSPNDDVTRAQMGTFVMQGADYAGEIGVWTPTLPTGETAAPELIQVNERSETSTHYVLEFVFDENISATGITPGDFNVAGYNGELIAADEAARDASQQNIVIATFDMDDFDDTTIPAGSLRYVSAATVDADAVTDIDDDLENPEGADAINSSVELDAGRTVGPDLLSVTDVNETDDTATFNFDEDLADLSASGFWEEFHLVLEDGTVIEPTGFDSATDADNNDESVTIVFSDFTSVQADMIARGYVENNTTITDDSTEASPAPPQSVDVNDNGSTNTPDLIAVSLDPDADEVTYTFDEPATVLDATFFCIYYFQTDSAGGAPVTDNNATTEAADSCGDTEEDTTVNADDTTDVVIAFADGEVSQDTVGAYVLGSAVDSNIDTDDNLFDHLGIAQTFPVTSPGETLSPDLLEVIVEVEDTDPFTGDPSDYNVIFRFDVDLDATCAAGANLFTLYEEDGESHTAPCSAGDVGDSADHEDNEVVFETSEGDFTLAQVEAAVRGGVAAGTVDVAADIDDDSRTNYTHSVGVQQP